jgi:hypothetical protein
MALKSDLVSRRTARRDPREEPDEAELAAPAAPEPEPSRPSTPVKAEAADGAKKVSIPPAPLPLRESVRPPITSVDPRFAEIEPLLSSSSWLEILKRLGPLEEAGRLPPTLGLIYAIALRESAGEKSATPANVLGIRCMAAIYGVAEESSTALLLAKRLLRQNPASWRTTPAPRARFSALIIAVAIVIGAGVGWLLGFGPFNFDFLR